VNRTRTWIAALAVALSAAGIAAKEEAALPPVNPCHDVALNGSTMYAGYSGLFVARDVSDPESPRLVGSVNLAGEALGIVLEGTRAYVANGMQGVTVIALTDPWVPVVLGHYNTQGSVRDLAVSGTLVAIADDIRGLELADLTNLEKPRSFASFPTRDRLKAVDWAGTTVATAEEDGGVRLIDVAQPESPKVRAVLDAVRPVYDVALCGGGVVVAAAGPKGLAVYAAGGSGKPILAATRPTAGRATNVWCRGKTALVSESGARLEVFDLESPKAPRVIHTIRLPRNASAGHGLIDRDLAFLAAGPAGIGVVRLSPHAPPEVLLPRPRKMQVLFP